MLVKKGEKVALKQNGTTQQSKTWSDWFDNCVVTKVHKNGACDIQSSDGNCEMFNVPSSELTKPK